MKVLVQRVAQQALEKARGISITLTISVQCTHQI